MGGSGDHTMQNARSSCAFIIDVISFATQAQQTDPLMRVQSIYNLMVDSGHYSLPRGYCLSLCHYIKLRICDLRPAKSTYGTDRNRGALYKSQVIGILNSETNFNTTTSTPPPTLTSKAL